MVHIKLFEELNNEKPKVLLFQGSPRDKDTCPNMESKTHQIIEYIVDKFSDEFEFDVIDLAVNNSKKSNIQPCKGCVSTAGGYHCHWTCISGDQRVHTLNGFKEIKNICVGDILQDGNKVLKVKKTSDAEKVYELKLTDGRRIELTSNHKVKILSKDRFRNKKTNWKYFRNEEWKELSEIKIGDILPNIETDLIYENIYSEDDILYLIFGLIWGDGTFANNTPLLYVDKKEIEFVDSLKNILSKYIISVLDHKVKRDFIRDENITYQTEMIKINFGTEIGKKMLVNFKKEKSEFRRLNIDGFRTKHQILNFLNGWISTDGTINKRGYILYNKSYDCLRDLQLILSRIGVKSRINDNRHLITEVKGKRLSRVCSLSIFDQESKDYLYRNMKLINPTKQNKLEKIFSESRRKIENKISKVKSINFIGIKEVYDIEVENCHEFNCEGIKVHNCDCYSKDSDTAPDFMHDADIYTKLEKCDAFLVFSPIHWYSVTSQVKAMFDRLVCANLTLTHDEAVEILGKGNTKNSELTGKLAQSGEHKDLLKNHLEGKIAGFYIHGDDGANDYEDKDLPDSFKPDNFEAKQTIIPIVNQCRYSGINVPNDLIRAFSINKGKDYYTANLDLEKLSKPFDEADSLMKNLKKYL
jgi:multimeric flavodoxin WrbA